MSLEPIYKLSDNASENGLKVFENVTFLDRNIIVHYVAQNMNNTQAHFSKFLKNADIRKSTTKISRCRTGLGRHGVDTVPHCVAIRQQTTTYHFDHSKKQYIYIYIS